MRVLDSQDLAHTDNAFWLSSSVPMVGPSCSLAFTNVINSGRRLDGAQLAAPALKCGLPEGSGGTKCLGEAAPFQELG